MPRRQVALGFLVIVIAATAAGWMLGRRVSSPAEIAARTAAPEPSPILVPAERLRLSTDVVTRGTGRFGTPRQVLLAPTRIGAESPVVTELPALGSQVDEGGVLVEASGRPVIVLQGAVPAFRDLGPGMVGNDVQQLEAALERLGHPPGPVDGRYDGLTGQAVAAMYAELGVVPALVGPAQLADHFPPGAYEGGTPSAGVMISAREIFFTPSLPVRVAEIITALGEPVDGSVLTVTDAEVAIDGSLPVEQAGLVTPGMTVMIDEPDLGITATGVVSRIAENPGTDGVDGFHLYFEVSVAEAPPSLINASVRLTIPIESTSGEVLVVPITALSLRGDGASIVQVDRGGTLEAVTVRPGLTAKGLVEVEPIDGQLAAGDLVMVGFDRPAVTTGDPAATTGDPTGDPTGNQTGDQTGG